MEAAPIPWRPLGRLLVEQGLLTEDELDRALDDQVRTQRRLGEIVVELGFVSHTALSRALAAQYGFELKSETGFGTGLRSQIERRHDDKRESELAARDPYPSPAPTLQLVPEPSDPEPSEPVGADLPLGQLEEQWAKLAAAEARLVELEHDLAAARGAAARRRAQAARFAMRLRAPAEDDSRPEPDAQPASEHVVLAQLANRYVLVDCDGPAPEPETRIVLPELDGTFVVGAVGSSPYPGDTRACALALPAPTE